MHDNEALLAELRSRGFSSELPYSIVTVTLETGQVVARRGDATIRLFGPGEAAAFVRSVQAIQFPESEVADLATWSEIADFVRRDGVEFVVPGHGEKKHRVGEVLPTFEALAQAQRE